MADGALPLEIRDLSKSFVDRRALDGVDLSLSPGRDPRPPRPQRRRQDDARAQRRRTRHTRPGTVRVLGFDASDARARSVRGWVPQEIALYPLLSARENLWTFGRYQGLTGAPLASGIRSSLDWIGLADRADDKTAQLSGGMKRRLNIAAGTIHGPKVLLLDEPTVGVDPQSRERIYGMIGELKARGVSLVYTTHYMEEAERLCDRVAIIDHGKIIASGTKDELVRRTVGARQAVLVETDGPIPARSPRSCPPAERPWTGPGSGSRPRTPRTRSAPSSSSSTRRACRCAT